MSHSVFELPQALSLLAEKAQKTDLYGVMGHPIAHSRSPQIHLQFALQTGQQMQYERFLVALDGFNAAINQLLSLGVKGCNITVPFKLEAYRWASSVETIGGQPVLQRQITSRAQLAGAVNTIQWDGAHLTADNTDGVGLVADITKNLQCPLKQKSVLLLGAGGAARGAILPLIEASPRLLALANRTPDKAQQLLNSVTQQAASYQVALQSVDLQQAQPAFDVIVNATSAGLEDTALHLPDSWVNEATLAYDMVYGKTTPFMAWARQHGAKTADGWGMLVEQAAAAFALWRGVVPDSQAVLSSVNPSASS